MTKSPRVLSIDVMRGLTLFLMLFVNDLYVPGVPAWLAHRPANYDGMGLADWVFPGFLFMVGMAVPFAIQSRIKRGGGRIQIGLHILIRTVSLLIIGVLMMNVGRLNPVLTGMPRNLWAILMYISVFLAWNMYPENRRKLSYILKGIGVVGLLVLVALFRSGTAENITWLTTGWWGILGLIGWGYLVTSLVYLFVKDNVKLTILIWFGFVGLNILSGLGLLGFLSFAKPIFGVIIDGNVPSIVMAGLVFSLIIRQLKTKPKRFVTVGVSLGLFSIIIAFVLRNWFIISKIIGTPSWAMLCNGISILLFVLLYIVIDMKGYSKWTNVFKTAGQNSLTTYLAPDIIYYSIWMSGFPILYYKQSEHAFVIIVGSVLWALGMILFAKVLASIGIRLKL